MTQAQISLALVHSHSTIMERNLLGAGGAKSSSARPKCTWTGPEPGAAHIHARQSLRASAVQRARRPTQHPAWPAEAPHHSSSFWGRGATTPKSPLPEICSPGSISCRIPACETRAILVEFSSLELCGSFAQLAPLLALLYAA